MITETRDIDRKPGGKRNHGKRKHGTKKKKLRQEQEAQKQERLQIVQEEAEGTGTSVTETPVAGEVAQEADRVRLEQEAQEQKEADRVRLEQEEADRVRLEQEEADRVRLEQEAQVQEEADRVRLEQEAQEQKEADRVRLEQKAQEQERLQMVQEEAEGTGTGSQILGVEEEEQEGADTNTYINTHIQGSLNDEGDELKITLKSPEETTFYEGIHDPENATQKKLIAYIFLFAKTVKKIKNSVKQIDELLDDTTKVNEVKKELDILHGLLEVVYNLPLQYGDPNDPPNNPPNNLPAMLDPNDLNEYFTIDPSGMINKNNEIVISFKDSNANEQNLDILKEYLDKGVYAMYTAGIIGFVDSDDTDKLNKLLKEFEKKYIEPNNKSMVSRIGSFFRGKNKTGGNKKQTRRQLQKPNRRTRRK